MKSKTKYSVDSMAIHQIFKKANLGDVSTILYLEAGEFNSAYFVTTESMQYVLKIAPKDNNNTLIYETNLMAQEVYFYDLIAKNTDVGIPKVYYYDDSKDIIPSPYFIMEKLNSCPLNNCKINAKQKTEAYKQVGEILTKLHSIKGERFGYIQNGLHDNWRDAIKAMVGNIIKDCKAKGKKCKSGYKLLGFIDSYKDILMAVKPSYVHFDLWDGNIFYANSGKISLQIIDTERGFWGDSIGDFVSVEMFKALDKKQSFINYNKILGNNNCSTKDQLIRYNILLAYLGLIVYTEKFYRYQKTEYKYYVNKIMGTIMFKKAFKALK